MMFSLWRAFFAYGIISSISTERITYLRLCQEKRSGGEICYAAGVRPCPRGGGYPPTIGARSRRSARTASASTRVWGRTGRTAQTRLANATDRMIRARRSRWSGQGSRPCLHATGCSSGVRRGCSRGLSRFRPSRSGQARRVRARMDGGRAGLYLSACRTSSRLAAAMPYVFEVMSVRSSLRIADCSMASIRRLLLVIKKPPARTDGYTRRLHKTRLEIVRASAHLSYTLYFPCS